MDAKLYSKKETDLYVIFFFFGNLQLRIRILEM